MANELVAPGGFQDRIFAKIKESIGDLMTDEDLKRLVEAAMQDAFFKPRVTTGNYGSREEKPPVLVELVTGLLKEKVAEALKAWVEAHHEDVTKLLNERINAGASSLLASAFDQRMQFAFQQFGEQIRQGLFQRP